MKTLYFECNMGASGDIIAGALLELVDNREEIIETINRLRSDGINLMAKSAENSGIRGTRVFITRNAEHTDSSNQHEFRDRHRILQDILDVIEDMPLNGRVRKNALGIAGLIAESVANTRGVVKEEAHLHDFASIDSIMIIVAICLIMDELNAEYIAASPICVGMGYTDSIYGTIPVPTPPTSYLLTNIPSFAGKFEGELCTTIGAAVLKWFVKDFEQMPKMSVKKIGCGIGKEKFTSVHCLRAFWGEVISTGANGEMTELVCTLDDMTAEAIGFVQKRLLETGAEEVYTSAVQMKKNRPGVKMTCICNSQNADDLAFMMLKYSTATYVGRTVYMSYSLAPSLEIKHTQYGDVRVNSYSGYGLERIKPVYDDIEDIAIKHNMTISETYAKILEEIK